MDRRPTLAVLYFSYDGPDKQLGMLKKGLAELLIADFAELDNLRVVERAKLESILAELKLNRSRKVDRRTANRIGRLLGAKYMVLGHYFDQLGQLCVMAKLVEVETGRILPSARHCAPKEKFLEIEQRVSQRLKQVLTTKLRAFSKRARPKRSRAKGAAKAGRTAERVGGPRVVVKKPRRLTMRMAMRYAKALDARDRGDTKKARALLEEIVKDQPDFQLAALELKKIVKRL